MEPSPTHPRDDVPRTPAQGFQSESAEHGAAPPVPATPTAWGPELAYQHEDDELVWPID